MLQTNLLPTSITGGARHDQRNQKKGRNTLHVNKAPSIAKQKLSNVSRNLWPWIFFRGFDHPWGCTPPQNILCNGKHLPRIKQWNIARRTTSRKADRSLLNTLVYSCGFEMKIHAKKRYMFHGDQRKIDLANHHHFWVDSKITSHSVINTIGIATLHSFTPESLGFRNKFDLVTSS